MSNSELISGQIILRDAQDLENRWAGPGRKLMMVVGVIAIPENLDLKGEHKYTIVGGNEKANGIGKLYDMIEPGFSSMLEKNDIAPGFDKIKLNILPETEENVSDETTGQGLGGIITAHHRWRV